MSWVCMGTGPSGVQFCRCLAVLLLLAVTLLPGQPAAAVTEFFVKQKSASVYLEKDASGPFLSFDKNASDQVEYVAESDPNSGPSQALKSLQNQDPVVYMIEMRDPLTQTYYLDLSARVTLRLHWTSAVAKPTNKEVAHIRMELLQGAALDKATRVAGHDFTTWTVAGSWASGTATLRSEVDKIDNGTKLYLRITRYSGLADFTLGTGANAQTQVDFKYFDENPLLGLAYLEGANLYVSNESSNPDPISRKPGLSPSASESASASNGWALGGLAGVPLIGLVLWRRGTPLRASVVLIVLLFFAASLGGCLGKSGPSLSKERNDATCDYPVGTLPCDTNIPPPPTKELECRKDLHKMGRGMIQGLIRDLDVRRPLKNVNVSMLGTVRFSITNAAGYYAFSNVTEGSYQLYFERTDFQEVEIEVEVVTGCATWLNVTMARSSTDINQRPHVHSHWDGVSKVVIQESRSFLPPAPKTPITGKFNRVGDEWYCVGDCEEKIPLDYSKNTAVPPGALRVEVILDWDANAAEAPKEFGLRIQTPVDITGGQTFVARKPGEPFNAYFFPFEADAGHQTFTNWLFHLRTPPTAYSSTAAASSTLGGPAYYKGGAVTLEINAYGGVTVFEKEHRDFWGNKTQLAIFDPEVKKSFNCLTVSCSDQTWDVNVPAIKYVPTGTEAVKGSFRWEDAVAGNCPIVWKLAYKGADSPKGSGVREPVTLREVAGATHTFEYTIPVTEETADQYYQARSYWEFYAVSEPIQGQDVDSCGSISVYLSATAHKASDAG